MSMSPAKQAFVPYWTPVKLYAPPGCAPAPIEISSFPLFWTAVPFEPLTSTFQVAPSTIGVSNVSTIRTGPLEGVVVVVGGRGGGVVAIGCVATFGVVRALVVVGAAAGTGTGRGAATRVVVARAAVVVPDGAGTRWETCFGETCATTRVRFACRRATGFVAGVATTVEGLCSCVVATTRAALG